MPQFLIAAVSVGLTVYSVGCSTDEPLGETNDAITVTGPEKDASTVTGATAVNTKSPSSAWIRLPNSGGGVTQVAGNGLVAFTRDENGTLNGEVAGWAVSTNWTALTPVWNAHRSADAATRWPAPDNLCEIYPGAFECSGTGDGWNKAQSGFKANGRYAHVANAIYSGLDGMASIVTTGGFGGTAKDVLIVTSLDGGLTFTHSQILTVDAIGGADSGGTVDPDSVYASVGSFGEETTNRAGQLSQPIYVIWQNTDGLGAHSWWFTRVVLGVSGNVAETAKPRPIAAIPAVSTTHASIFGYRMSRTFSDGDQSGAEHVGVAWSVRDDSAAPITCPSNTTTRATWYAADTSDFGSTWGCFTGAWGGTNFKDCSGGKTQIAVDTTWRPCVGPKDASGTGNRQYRNHDRPEVAMNTPAVAGAAVEEAEDKKTWFFAINRSNLGNGGMRVCLLETWAGGLVPGIPGTFTDLNSLTPINCTSQTAPNSAVVEDQWAQSLAVMGGRGSAAQLNVLHLWNTLTSPAGVRADVVQWSSGSSTLTESLLTDDAPTGPNIVPFTFEKDAGLNTGLSVYQQCDPGVTNCPSGSSFSYPHLPILAAWPDTRKVDVSVKNDIFTRGYKW